MVSKEIYAVMMLPVKVNEEGMVRGDECICSLAAVAPRVPPSLPRSVPYSSHNNATIQVSRRLM